MQELRKELLRNELGSGAACLFWQAGVPGNKAGKTKWKRRTA